jgi:DNA polymerase I-like protein with 3'-5' exonuclease and polymerase domains
LVITIDFETYYDREFSLSKITTEEYVRDRRFEVIGVGVKVDEGETEWFSGTEAQTKFWLGKFKWSESLVLAHNMMFDGAIMAWRFDINPKGWLDTLCMGRAVDGVEVSGSLKNLAERYEVGEKGTEVVNALGKRRKDFSEEELARYGEYCRNDVELTYKLFNILSADFPTKELKVIDLTLRMFTHPVLKLDLPLLEQHLLDVVERKEKLLEATSASKDDLMSNDKFAQLLIELGVDPPRKISLTTGREAWAFAKTDEDFKALSDHPDDRVQALVAARLGNKTTLEETRTQRFIDIAKRGLMPVPLKYYAAHTGRWGGDDKVNLQNLPSRGQNAGHLKSAICPPKGHVIIDADSSQIEARTLAWLAEQDDLVEAFDKGEDVYKIMASAIYGKPQEEITKDERFVGKTTILGAGYGMGAIKFQAQLKTFNAELSEDECKRIIKVYRETYPSIPNLWRSAQACLESILQNQANTLGRENVLEFSSKVGGFKLPSGLWQRYDGT